MTDDHTLLREYDTRTAEEINAEVAERRKADAPATEAVALTKEVERLAALPSLDYEQVREGEADRLGVRVRVLDNEVTKARKSAEVDDKMPGFCAQPEPWPEPVDGASLADEIERAILRYVVLPALAIKAIVLYVLHTHALDCSPISPILAIESPEKRCGKTTLLILISHLVPRSFVIANMTGPTFFRTVEDYKPTLVIDEADRFLRDEKSDLIGMLNASHMRMTANIPRCVGDKHELKVFSTWCAKIIALIRTLPATLQDRAIVIRMRRRMKGETVTRFRADRPAALKELCRMGARWAADIEDTLGEQDPEMSDKLDDRAADNWRPLVAIADAIGGDWPDTARAAALKLSGVRIDDEDGDGLALLEDVRDVMNCDHLTPSVLLMKLLELTESRWTECGKFSKPLSTRGMAKLLGHYGIASDQQRVKGDKARRYYRKDFRDAWKRYLPAENDGAQPNTPEISGTSGTPLKNKGKTETAFGTAD